MLLPPYFASYFKKIKWSNVFPKLIQTKVTLNKSSKNDKKKKTKTVNIFKRQSVCIYILFRLGNMDFEERNFGE